MTRIGQLVGNLLVALPLLLSSACGGKGGAPMSETSNVVFFGDSLTEGYSLGEAEAYPALIEQKILEAGLPFSVVNAGRSGDTTADALPRLPGAMRGQVALLFIALGTNDVRKRFEIEAIKARFSQIIEEARQISPNTTIVLAGVDAFTGAPIEYQNAFKSMLSELATSKGIPYLASPLAGVHGVPALNLPDELHPNAAGHRIIAENVWAFLEPILRSH